MGITFLQGRICNTVVVHYGVSHSTLVTTSSRTVCTQQLRRVWFSSSQHQTHHRVQKQTQNSEHVSQTSALDGQHTKSTQKKHTSLKYSLNSLQIWQRNHRRQRVSYVLKCFPLDGRSTVRFSLVVFFWNLHCPASNSWLFKSFSPGIGFD